MPTYQYACTECDHAFEQVQSFSDDSLTECPQCAGRLRKIFNAVGVVFKGSGFYRTDSRASEAKSSGKGDGTKSSSSGSDGSSSTGASAGSEGSSSTGSSSAGSSSAGSSSTGSSTKTTAGAA